MGDVLDKMPLPGDPAGGPMHRVPALAWKTWVRLAFVEAGSDWRSLNKLVVQDGMLRDYLIVPNCNHGSLGVLDWDQPAGAVCGNTYPTNGRFSVADPRFSQSARWHDGQAWEDASGAIAGGTNPGQGVYSVADPRPSGAHSGRDGNGIFGKYHVTRWDETSGTILAGSTTGQSAFAVADPRPGLARRGSGDAYVGGGHYGVLNWRQPSGAVSAVANCDNGRFSVADPRLPAANDKLVCVIRALDGTWHRPFTTLELAALQSLIDPDEMFTLDGQSDQNWRERIGNAVPPDAARAIAETMGTTLLLAWSGETFLLSNVPIWVKPVAVALAVGGDHG
ncbi:MAG: DNA cytosine methyltransferase [Zoogloeaceae bacterium]|nr:DNA cytosine methyltransferase [Zoogloeaceae bacterium]